MSIHALAARHHTVGLESLDQLSALRGSVVVACPGVQGVVVLATCNRVEIYLDLTDDGPLDRSAPELLKALAQSLDLPLSDLEGALEPVPDPGAHLCQVAAGLDSMVLGEREIAGQVRRAMTRARTEGTSTGALERLFAAASRAARRVANETDLGSRGRSLVDVALDTAGMLPGARCVLVGTGSYAGAAVAALTRRGAGQVAVYSASGRAAEFASPRGLGTISTDALPAAIAAADLVVTCSGHPDRVLGPEHFDLERSVGPWAIELEQEGPEPAASQGQDLRHDDGARRPLVVVDLALGRDVDPAVGELPHVRLVAMRDLAGCSPAASADDVARARAIAAEVAAELTRADRAVAWGGDLAAARRRALDAHPPQARRRAHARLHGASALARDAARAGDRRRFDAALLDLEALADRAALV